MPITVTGQSAAQAATPIRVSSPLLEFAEIWPSDPTSDVSGWRGDPDIELVSCSTMAVGGGIGTLEIKRRYGQARSPHDAPPVGGVVAERGAIDLLNQWVRLVLINEQGVNEVQWVGRVTAEMHNVHPGTLFGSGVQTWKAHEPIQWLSRIHPSKSIWLDDSVDPAVEKEIGWIPDVNIRDHRNVLVGNRSATTSDAEETKPESYLYGGNDTWTHLDYLLYILARFVDDGGDDGPIWRVGGQSTLLDSITDSISLSLDDSVASILEKLIPRQLGVGFKIVPIPETPSPGFEIHVFALNSRAFSFGGVTLPRNPDKLTIRPATDPNISQIRIANDLSRQADVINVWASRVIVNFSLRGRLAPGGEPLEEDGDPSLGPHWTDALEETYKEGTGVPTDPAPDHDKARARDLLRTVYQQFGAPKGWKDRPGILGPVISSAGVFNAIATKLKDGGSQEVVRSTLPYLTLFEGIVYSTSPPTDLNPAGHQPEMRPTAVFLLDSVGKWILADTEGISVQTLPSDWGVLLGSKPNHRLAKNHFTGAAQEADSADDLDFDHEKMIVTLAVESDQRLGLRFEMTSGTSPIQTELNIVDEQSEMWIMEAGTVTDVTALGELDINGANDVVLRNDAPRLAMVMAGAISRYNVQRSRAVITLNGLWPWAQNVGSILEVIEKDGDTHFVQSPVTAVEWRAGGGLVTQTVIKTGYA